uniref:Protein kinase domain-containing protein n=1 Tax=Physcomitrium patens TaxID=3218 RepID=A0A2K1KC09_PHYPA|nr:hypothetical protein PHYPA_010494 [Physcomitrium patens]
MCYLHDIYIVHHNLKLNILVNIVEKKSDKYIVRHAIVKVIDFRICNTIYIVLEVLKNKYKRMTMCSFDTDVFSFAMMCYKILSKKDPFDDCRKNEIFERFKKGTKQEVLLNCDELMELIEECWNLNPLH